MIEQTYYLDMIPGESAPPVVHVSQFDVNSRTLTFNLMKGGVAYEPDIGMTVTLDGTKPDNTAFSYPMTVDGSSVSIALQTQMTVVAGHVRCEVTVSNASGQIGSANFILAVEESAIDTGAISDTDIPIFEDLKNQAQQAAAEATAAAQTVSAILPENVGTVGQVLTKTGTGAEWDDVDGLPAGGTVGQVLTKNSSTDGDASWQNPTGGGTWGSITGTISDQTDLQDELDDKADLTYVETLTGSVATIEESPATANHAVGDFIVYNGQLYSVISAITAGNALVVGTNISATSAGAELTTLKNGLIVFRDFGWFSGEKPSGTIGQRYLYVDTDVTLTGYTPVAVTIYNSSYTDSTVYVPLIVNLTTARTLLYHAKTEAGTYRYSIRVLYIKTPS